MNEGNILHKWMRALRSRKTACWLLGLTAAACVVGELAGACLNEELRGMVTKGYDTNEAYDRDYRTVRLPYSLRLKEFRIERNAADGTPTQYAATVVIDGKETVVAVNDPHSMGLGENIYLVDFEPTDDDGNVDACLMMVAAQLLNPDYKCPLVVGKAFEGDVASHGLHEFAT